MKTRVVQFTENNARILVVGDATAYRGLPFTLINPSLDLVVGVPPHLWKLEGGDIVPMTEPEVAARLISHATRGVINDGVPSPTPGRLKGLWVKYGGLAMAFLLGVAATLLIRI